MKSSALFPISVSNQRFSSERASELLPLLLGRYDEIVFFVADSLQHYNRALLAPRPECLSEVLRKYRRNQHHLDERQRWLRRLRRKLDPEEAGAKWVVRGSDDFADVRFFHIFRNVMLAYYTLKSFRLDIAVSAREYVRTKKNSQSVDVQLRLSTGYLLEELAFSVRIRVLEKIWDEYYDGRQASVILRFYEGAYPLNVFDLAEVKVDLSDRFRFFRAVGTAETPEWEECHTSSC